MSRIEMDGKVAAGLGDGGGDEDATEDDGQHWMTCSKRVRHLIWIAIAAYVPFVLVSRSIFGVKFDSFFVLGIQLSELNFALIAIMGAVALSVLTSFTGQLSLGHAALFSIGALSAAFLGVQQSVPFLLVLPIAGLAGMSAGVVVALPAVRLKGIYLLLATLALHFVIVYGFTTYQLRYFGPAGITYPRPSVFGVVLESHLYWYFVLLPFAVASVMASSRLVSSHIGRSFMATRDNELVASAVGISTAQAKTRAFAFSSFVVSVSGALFVFYLGNATDELFTLILAIEYIAMIVIGGLFSIRGAVYGALFWHLFPSAAETLAAKFGPMLPVGSGVVASNHAQVVQISLGLVVIGVLIWYPAGIAGFVDRIRQSRVVRWRTGSEPSAGSG